MVFFFMKVSLRVKKWVGARPRFRARILGMDKSGPSSPETWSALEAAEWAFGPMPAEAVNLQVELAHTQQRRRYTLFRWQIQVGKPAWIHWDLCLAWPSSVAAAPVLLTADACWPHVVGRSALRQCLSQRVALAWVDRTQWACDDPARMHLGPVHKRWPQQVWSAMAVWAWGLNASAEALRSVLGHQVSLLGVVGHSRGGKAALWAASVNPRIDAVVANNSGTLGAASLTAPPLQAETLGQLVQAFPHWVSAQAARQEVQQLLTDADAPFHWLRAIAPRGLCILQAADDLWANPEGTRRMVERLAPSWRDFPGRLQLHHRSGGHAMSAADWLRAAAFVRRLSEGHRPDPPRSSPGLRAGPGRAAGAAQYGLK
jgi:dienelactone hydrolase